MSLPFVWIAKAMRTMQLSMYSQILHRQYLKRPAQAATTKSSCHRLLALFGEQFARQFISESVTFLDHVIFCMAPLGIITAIIGAIRVAGPRWARAFIGRARENGAAPELEIMSSTSREVCEMFNGRGVVRAMGKPKLSEFILVPSEIGNVETCGIHTLRAAHQSANPVMDFLRFDYYPPNDPTPIEERESKKRDEEQGSRPPGMGNRTYLRKRKIN
jgi:hypothetical protein